MYIKPKVTIGIPVYNVEQYIERCCISLFSQTYDNIEYLFVDDCGFDNSISLIIKTLSDFPKRKPYVSIIKHEKNRGLAAARNTIIDNATGIFLIWVDSDDWVEHDMVEKCVRSQIENDSDLVTFGYVIHKKHCNIKVKKHYFQNSKDYSLAIIRREVPTCVWSNMIRLSLYLDNNIRVEEGINMGEDFQQLPRLTYYSKKISYVDEILYNYNYMNETGYCNSEFKRTKWLQNKRSYEIIDAFFRNKDEDFNKSLNIMKANYVASQLILLTKSTIQHQEYNEIVNMIGDLDKNSITVLPFEYKVVLLLKNVYLVAVFVKIAKFIKFVSQFLFNH